MNDNFRSIVFFMKFNFYIEASMNMKCTASHPKALFISILGFIDQIFLR